MAPIVVYLLSDAAAAINGKIFKFNGTTLAPVIPAALSDQALHRASWTVAEIAAACEGPLAPLLRSNRGACRARRQRLSGQQTPSAARLVSVARR